MKIAIVGPSPVPFTIGGAENLLWGLCDSINQLTPHQAEIIKLPSKEHDFWSLIDNYYAFYKLDLSHFDLIISTKYPSWMVRHRNSICYMIHTLRGLYDTYHLMNMPMKVNRGNEKIDQILDYMDNNPHPSSLDDFFVMLFSLKENRENIPNEYFAFPAPFIRLLVHYMDQYGLSQEGVKHFYAISDTVRKRSDYFPKNANIKVVYPPSKLDEFKTGDYKYIFMISRLDSPKRIDMLINAMKYVKSNVKLLIAGTGPQEEQLKKLANGDSRIEFLGFVNDDKVEDYYANSLVIPYFPYDEDYGLITIEAMMHKKPVITTVDAGGPTEFVINNETGFITKYDPKSIGEKIDYFAQYPEEAKRMGENGYNKVKDISWVNTVKGILNDLDSGMIISKKNISNVKNKKRKKITLTSTFPIFPPQGGGQARTYHLYKNLAEFYDIEIVSLINTDKKRFNGFIASGMKENRIPKSEKHQALEWEIEKKAGIVVSDIANLRLICETPEYSKELEQAIKTSSIVILSHPYLFKEVKKYINDQIIIYDAQDVEYIIKKEMLPNNNTTQGLLKELLDVERECCQVSKFIMTCSEKDKISLSKLYQVPLEKIIVVPNGVDCKATQFTSVDQRLENKNKLGLHNEKIGLFMGSWHKPNLEACEEIFKIAPKCPDVKFLLMGSQCTYFEQNKRKLPPNVGMLGLVSEDVKNRVFSTVDFALNPMMSGSGTNLKMFDYMSAGIPVITTEFGSRGIDNKDVLILAEIDKLEYIIKNFELTNFIEMVEKSRKYTERTFDWEIISKIMADKL